MKRVYFLIAIGVLNSCAKASSKYPNHNFQEIQNSHGFWDGLWHGMIVPFSFIGRIFSDKISIYAIENSGLSYDFGFVLGPVVLFLIIGFFSNFKI